MMVDTLSITSGLDLLLRQDICQRIHYAALRAAARRLHPEAIPEGVPVAQLHRYARLMGPSSYLLPPDAIEHIFVGVTLSVYQTIESLYCDRIGRSIGTVWQILQRMARQTGKPPVDYGAAWAICLYLEEKRADSIAVTVEHCDTVWQIASIVPEVSVRNGDGSTCQPTIVCVFNSRPSEVLAFRIAEEGEVTTSTSLAIYDALVSRRRPSVEGAAGLMWQIPARIATHVDVTPACRNACEQIGPRLESASGSPPLRDSLQGTWTRDLTGRLLTRSELAMRFDNYLEKTHGHGPLRALEQKAHEFVRSAGYSRDPAWQFPALRQLLPQHAGIISDAAVEYDGLHYEHELLNYWPDQPVTLRQSESAEKTAWIYLYGDVLCQAMARELRRKDGSYRPDRSGR